MESKELTPPSLHEELISYEIFPRLPPRTIHRFRCVSASCRRLTSDKLFHDAVRRLSRRRYRLSFSVKRPRELALYSVDQSGAAAVETPQKPLVHANTVNGLTFTVQAGDVSEVTPIVRGPFLATVSNAATNETFHLPPFPVISSLLRFYFCHDPETGTYKVLRTAIAYNDPSRTTKCSIFTLGAETASWRDFDLLRLKQSGDSKSVCINGTLYLTKFCLDNNNAVIGAFAVKEEHFVYPVSYPAGLSPSRYYHCHLIELKGALAVIDVGKVSDLWKCEIKLWIKEKGDHESWTELRIRFDPRWEMTFKLSKSCSFSTNYEGEIVMGVTGWRTNQGCWIFTYNVEKGEWRGVEIRGLGEDRYIGDLRVEENETNIFSLTQTLNPSIKSSTKRLS